MGRILAGVAMAPLVLGAPLAGCAGQPEFARGHAGPAVPARTVALVMAPGAQASPLGPPLRTAVAAALARHGLEVVGDAPVRIEMAVGERPSGMTITGADGSAIAPGIGRQFLQGCGHRTWRVVVAWSGDGAASGRGVAERAGCHGRGEDVLPGLAERAVAELVGPRG